jgi:hypothetical protein
MKRHYQPTELHKLLAPCPVCQVKDPLDLKFRTRDIGPDAYFVRCGCGLEGPNRRDAEKAIAAWNLATEKEIARPRGCACMSPEPLQPKVVNPTRSAHFEFVKLR